MKLLTTIVLSLLVYHIHAAIIYVDADSNALFPNGNSWAQAYPSISDLNNDDLDPGDEIWVAEGTYTGRVNIYNEVPVYGGFAGWETQRSQRNWETNVVSIVQLPIDDYSYTYAALVAQHNYDNGNLLSTALIDGVRFVNWGNLISSSYLVTTNSYGGDMDLTVRNCTFSLGTTQESLLLIDPDTPSSSILFDNCVFESLSIGDIAQFNSTVDRTIEYRDCEFLSCNFGEDPDEWTFRYTQFVRTYFYSCGMPAMAGWGCDFNTCLIEDCSFLSEESSAFQGCDLVNTTLVNNYCGKRLASTANFYSCIFFNNSTYQNVSLLSESQTYAINSILQEPFSGAGSNNVVDDPLFTNAPNGDYSLSACSRAIDNSGIGISLLSEDLAGNPRVFNGNIDAGCYEYQGVGRSVIYVNKDAVGNADGSSWENAFTHIQDAINVQCAHSEIWVTNHIYYPNPNPDSPNRFASIFVTDGTELYGGFVGDEVSRDDRPNLNDPSALRTRITGTNGTAAQTDDAYQNMSIGSGANNVIIDGFYMSLGRADGFGSFMSGGAIFAQDVQAVLKNCRFEANSGTEGGAISIFGDSQFEMINCVFSFNSTDGNGGAVYCLNQASEEPEIELDRCWFVGNSAQNGGGIYAGNSAVSISNSLLNINSASSQGDAVYSSDFLQMINCTVQGHNEAVHIESTNLVYNCIFWENNTDFTLGNSVSPGDQEIAFSHLSYPTPGVGNASQDPLFENAAAWLFQLQSGSPCINSGEMALSSGNLDLGGNARIVDGDVDRGAYEYGVSCAAPNDLCADAIGLDPYASTTISADMACASPEVVDIDNPCGAEGARSLWYTFTMPSHEVELYLGDDPSGSVVNWSMTLYKGSCGDLVNTFCTQSTFLSGLFNPGEEVIIKVQQWPGGSETMALNMEPYIPEIISVQALDQDVCEPMLGTSVYDQLISIEHVNGEYYDSFIINGVGYQVTSSPQYIVLENVPADGNELDLEVILEGSTESMSITNFVQTPCCAPLNDECYDALPVALGFPVIGRLDCATISPEDILSSCTQDPGRSMWYEFVAPETGTVDLNCVIVELNGIFNIRISVWDVSDGCADAVELGCINEYAYNLPESGTVSGLNPGQTYKVMISGWQNQNGTYELTISEAETPCGCLGDLNSDCEITSPDLLIFLSGFGCLSNCEFDLDGEEGINAGDLLVFLSVFSSTCAN